MDRRKFLPAALRIIGIGMFLVYPAMLLLETGWVWLPTQYEYEQMIAGIYATLGVFLILAARRPEEHASLIWFTVWSSVVHGGMMAIQAGVDSMERVHFSRDIPTAFAVAVVLGVLAPRGAMKAPR